MKRFLLLALLAIGCQATTPDPPRSAICPICGQEATLFDVTASKTFYQCSQRHRHCRDSGELQFTY